MPSLSLAIEGMSCHHCLNAVNKALTALPGVTIASVRIGPGTRSGVGWGPMISARPVERLAARLPEAEAAYREALMAGYVRHTHIYRKPRTDSLTSRILGGLLDQHAPALVGAHGAAPDGPEHESGVAATVGHVVADGIGSDRVRRQRDFLRGHA